MGPGPPGEWGPSPRVDGARVDKGRSLGGLGPGPQVYGARSSGWLRARPPWWTGPVLTGGRGPGPRLDGAHTGGHPPPSPDGRGPGPHVDGARPQLVHTFRFKLVQGCAGKWGARSAESVRNIDALKMAEGDDRPPPPE